MHGVAFPNLQGFACNPPVLVAVKHAGNTSLPMTNDAFLMVHGSPYGDNVVKHFLQGATDIAWFRQLPLGELGLFNFQVEGGERLVDMGVRNLHYGSGAAVMIYEDVPTLQQ